VLTLIAVLKSTASSRSSQIDAWDICGCETLALQNSVILNMLCFAIVSLLNLANTPAKEKWVFVENILC